MPGRHGGTLRRGGPGRPKGSCNLATAIRRVLNEENTELVVQTINEVLSERNGNESNLHQLARLMIQHAKNGKSAFAKEINNRVDGPIPRIVIRKTRRRR